MKRNANIIKQVIDSAEQISAGKINWMETEISRTQDLLNGLFGIETEAKKKIENKLRELQSYPKDRIQKLKEISIYRRLSLEPLSWRDNDKFPKLAIFSLTSPVFSVAVRCGIEEGYSYFSSCFYGGLSYAVQPILPESLMYHPEHLPWDLPDYLPENLYKDVIKHLEGIYVEHEDLLGRSGLELACRFEGLIPNEVKKKIDEARKWFGNNIFIIAEAKNFTLNEIVSLKADPLVVGYDSSVDKYALWLIAGFDITPTEEAMIYCSNSDPNRLCR